MSRWKRRFIWQLHVFTKEIGFCESFLHVCRLNPVYGLAALDVFILSPTALSDNLAALVIAGGHYILTVEAASQLAADFGLPVCAPAAIEGA